MSGRARNGEAFASDPAGTQGRLAWIEDIDKPLEQAQGLPPRCYTDPGFFSLEVDHVLSRSWLCMGRVQQIPEPGDFFTLDMLGEPLVVVRDRERQVRVLSAVCRHRFMPVVTGSGRLKAFRCPYHTWTYDLDGRLVSAPEMTQAAGFDAASCRLPELRSEIWEGFVFVNFDPNAAPLAPDLEPVSEFLAPYRLAEMVPTAPVSFDLPWNWKIQMENSIESYHHIGAHTQTLEVNFPGRKSYALDGNGPYTILRHPPRGGGAPRATLSGSPVSEDFPADRLDEFVVVSVLPTLVFGLLPGHLVYIRMQVQDVANCRIDIFPGFPAATLANPDYGDWIAANREAIDVLQAEDTVVCSGVQRGVQSRHAGRGRMSHLEKAVWQFHRWLGGRMLGSDGNGRAR